MLNKKKADVNVYNDLDSELVHFFIVYRECPERLIKYLNGIPHSYEVYEDFVDAFYGPANEEPDGRLPGNTITDNFAGPDDISRNDVKRAAVFFTLRYMQFGAKYQSRSGFGRSKVQNGSATFTNAKERLERFIGCWDDVTIENVSFEKLQDSYDSEETFWYCDPPYIGTEDYYRESDFSHEEFVDWLLDLEGYWMVSYDEIPERLEDFNVSVEESTNFIDSGVKGEGKSTIETLVTNYDPSDVQKFTSSSQSGFDKWDKGQKSEPQTNGQDDGFLQSVDSGGSSEDEDDNDGGFLSNVEI